MKPMKHITTENMDGEFTHHFGGNGYAIVEMLPLDMCRVAPVGRGEVSPRAFLAWQKLLNPYIPPASTDPKLKSWRLQDDVAALTQLKAIRKDLAEGRLRVVASHIVEA